MLIVTHFGLTGEESPGLFLTAITTTSNTNAVPPAPITSPITILTAQPTGEKPGTVWSGACEGDGPGGRPCVYTAVG